METKTDGVTEKEVIYLVESGCVFLAHPDSKVMDKYEAGSVIKLLPRVAARLLLNKGRPLAVVEAERSAVAAAAKAVAEANA